MRDRLTRAACSERRATADLVALLAEFDRRQLYLTEGHSSLFVFCTVSLHLSEAAAYARIQAARAAREFPSILDAIRTGAVTLTTIYLLAPHLTHENCSALLLEARHKRKRDVELIVARLRPQPDVPSVIRKLPAARPGEMASTPGRTTAELPVMRATPQPHLQTGSIAADPSADIAAPPTLPPPVAKPAVVAPLTPERYKLQITIDRHTHALLRQAQDLMRHALPNGDPAVIIAKALRLLVEDLLRKKAAAVAAPRHPRAGSATSAVSGRSAASGTSAVRSASAASAASVANQSARITGDNSRTIPAVVRREVWARDQGRCAFRGTQGRCNARGLVEYHHVIPYALGGRATVGNIELRCRAHNAHEARLAGLDRPEERREDRPEDRPEEGPEEGARV